MNSSEVSPETPPVDPAPAARLPSRGGWWLAGLAGGLLGLGLMATVWWKDSPAPERQVAVGLEQLAAGILDEAQLQPLVELARRNPRVRGLGPLFEGALATAQGRTDEALQRLATFQPGEVSRVPLLMTLAQTLEAAGKGPDAAQVYQELLKHD